MIHRNGEGEKTRSTVCVRAPGADGKRVEELASSGTTTPDLLAPADWLAGHGVTQVAMEGTGVYWKPCYRVLEQLFELRLVNARHVKNLPDRKTDTKDAAWLCRLLEHGLLRKSFLPPREIRDLRDLTRYRKALIRERAAEVNRLHKVLEDAGAKLSSVASDIMGVSARAMLEALVAGTNDPELLAELAKARLRAKLPAPRKALDARFRDDHGFLVAQVLAHVDYLEEAIAAVGERIERRSRLSRLRSSCWSRCRACSRTAEVVVAEIGVDMSRFPTNRHLASWAGCARATTRAPASASTAARPRAAPGCCVPRRWRRRSGRDSSIRLPSRQALARPRPPRSPAP
jgi:transposase